MMQLQCFLRQPQEKYLSTSFQNIQVETPLDFGGLYFFAFQVIEYEFAKLFIAEAFIVVTYLFEEIK